MNIGMAGWGSNPWPFRTVYRSIKTPTALLIIPACVVHWDVLESSSTSSSECRCVVSQFARFNGVHQSSSHACVVILLTSRRRLFSLRIWLSKFVCMNTWTAWNKKPLEDLRCRWKYGRSWDLMKFLFLESSKTLELSGKQSEGSSCLSGSNVST